MPSINMNSNKTENLEVDDLIDDDYTEPEIDYEEIRVNLDLSVFCLFYILNYSNNQKRRERNDFASKKLGELLLRGYKMLDETCDKCGVRLFIKHSFFVVVDKNPIFNFLKVYYYATQTRTKSMC